MFTRAKAGHSPATPNALRTSGRRRPGRRHSAPPVKPERAGSADRFHSGGRAVRSPRRDSGAGPLADRVAAGSSVLRLGRDVGSRRGGLRPGREEGRGCGVLQRGDDAGRGRSERAGGRSASKARHRVPWHGGAKVDPAGQRQGSRTVGVRHGIQGCGGTA